MSSFNSNAKASNRPKIPPKGSEDSNSLSKVVDYGIKHESYFRLSSFRKWQECALFAEGYQWLEPDDEAGRSLKLSVTSPYLRPIRVSDSKWYPMPVQNEIVAPLQNEQSRLLGVGSRPYVRPKSTDSNVEKAARLATDVLLDTLDQIGWAETEIQWIDDIPLLGTGILKTWWEYDYTDTVNIPVETALRCPMCEATLATDLVRDEEYKSEGGPQRHEQAFVPVESVDKDGNDTILHKANFCPSCMANMEPFTPMPGDGDDYGVDMFGRSLSEPVPKGKIAASVVSPYNYFPQSLGVGLTNNTISEHYEEHIESLDWISQHYDKGHLVKRESGIELSRWHPVIGGGSRWLGTYADNTNEVFDNHARVREFHKKPWIEVDPETGERRLNRGRSIVKAGDIILLDDDYMIESQTNPGKLIPRVEYHPTQWEAKKNQIWGLSAVELMIPLQKAINSLLSQVQDARHRFGSPKLLMKAGTNLQYAGQLDTGYPSDVWEYQDPMDGSAPTFFGNTQMQGDHFRELEQYINAINRITGTMDVEIGQAPKNISSASGVMFVGEKASERRRKRVIRLREAKRKAYRHILQLIHEMYREERIYHVRGRNDKWEVKAFTGQDILGQDDVQLEDEPYYDLKLFKRESIKDGLEIGTISADSAIAKRKINKDLGISLDINEETNIQVMNAEDEWLSYIYDDKAPYVDVRADDHQIHFKQNISSIDTMEGKELHELSRWDEFSMVIWGWEKQLDRIEQMEAMLETSPPSPEPEMPPPGPDGIPDPAVSEQMRQVWEQKMQMQQELMSYPQPTELRIMAIWQQKLEQFVQGDMELAEKVMKMARWRAHLETHFRLASAQSVAAGQGVPIPAPPGGQETQMGNVPGNPVMAMPGPGTGPGATTASGDGGA